ncbi:MAG: glycosyltransferase [Bacteroidota bacterium]|nr:glycosyltransferase [Bacteroidota bacterium]
MPRILRVMNRFNLGGPTFNASYLTKYLPSEYETLLVGGIKDPSEESSEFILEQLGIKPIIISEMQRSINLKNDYAAFIILKNIICDFKPDIVHTHASKAGTLGRLAAISMKVPYIVHTFHGHVFNAYFNKISSAFYKNIERYLASHSTKIIAISNKQKEELSNIHHICSPEKIEVIPLGFDLDKFHNNMDFKRKTFRERYMIDDDEIAISIIGRIVQVKNHPLFIDAVNYVKNNSNKKIRVFIVGDGDARLPLEEKIKNIGIDFTDWNTAPVKSTITFTSWIKEVDYVTSGSEIIALTSFDEGTPVSLIEAQASDKPVISTNVGGIEDVVIPGKTALLSPNGDVDSFSKNLLLLVEDDNLRKEMSTNGWNFVSQKFNYTRLVNDTAKLYEKIMNNK